MLKEIDAYYPLDALGISLLKNGIGNIVSTQSKGKLVLFVPGISNY
ncbi:anti-anti-sigma regulatory factor [Candidatus Brocadia sinica JPN1]|uniref:Anti-anti-sigma regulatory factor n=1 Tax=Candidatus Brocadia sinica JPN1 TaxID=1197129 RepID=A0ABQ0JXG2_9BACT|nr:anti-anti-sigma regulatory factor [Candidatus Brocadia sinica JPN1]